MANFTVNLRMLVCKGKLSCIMVKRVDLFIDIPAFCTMTGAATDLKAGTVRMTVLPAKKKQAADDQ
jgi:hypothetical protein